MRSVSTRKRSGGKGWVAFFIVAFVLASSGCATLMPRTSAIDRIHQTYRLEFQQSLQSSVPSPSDVLSGQKERSQQPAFAETLREIRDYRLKFGEDSQESAHLTVLEGMIYLQSGQIGMARLVESDVQTAGSSLRSGTGTYARDELLAAVFPSLVDGWEQIRNEASSGTDHEKLEKAANKIAGELDQLDASKLAQPEIDEGAIYIATNAAIFYVWVYAKRCPYDACSKAIKAEWFGKGRQLIGRFLTEMEKKASAKSGTEGVPPGRLRYISWYGFLSQGASQP